jgi:hypothetical protein
MEAHEVDKILIDNLPALRAAKSYVEVPTVEYGDFKRLTRVSDERYKDRIGVVTGPQGLNTRGQMSTGVACFIKGKWKSIRVSLDKLDPFTNEALFIDHDNQDTTLDEFASGTFELTSSPEGFLTDKVTESQARLIGLIVEQHLGFHGLVRIADSRRQYTPYLSRVYNYIGNFLA